MLESEDDCPFPLLECIHTLIWAAAVVPNKELNVLKHQLTLKYGPAFVTQAEISSPHTHDKVRELLREKSYTFEDRVRALQAVAAQATGNNCKYDPQKDTTCSSQSSSRVCNSGEYVLVEAEPTNGDTSAPLPFAMC